DHSSGGGNIVAWASVSGKPSSFAPSDHAHTSTPGDGGLVSYGSITGKPSSFTPSAHALDPASGYHTGDLPWANVSGKPSTFAPSAHKTSHQNGGTDELGLDWSQLTSGVPSTFAPSAHKTSHQTGGSDAMLPGDQGGFDRYATVGTVGRHVYVGSTTPSSPAPAEGDIWIKG